MAKVFTYHDNIVGINVHNVWTMYIKGHNCDFEYYRDMDKRYEIYIKDTNIKVNRITLWVDYTECSSGWSTATIGRMKKSYVSNRGSITHIPKEFIKTRFLEYCKDPSTYEHSDNGSSHSDDECDYMGEKYEYNDGIIIYSENGGCTYYPTGYVKVNLDNFTPTGRGFDKPVIWLVTGGDLSFSYKLTDNIVHNHNQFDNILCKYNVFNVDNITNLDEMKRFIGGIIVTINIQNNDNEKIIFVGPSNIGKSFLAHKYYEKVFETDSNEVLKADDDYNVVVIGNKYEISVDDITSLIGDCKICTFSL